MPARDIEWVTQARPCWEHTRPKSERVLLRELFTSPSDFGSHECCIHIPVQVSDARAGHLLVYLPEQGNGCNKVFLYRVPTDEHLLEKIICLAEDSLARVR